MRREKKIEKRDDNEMEECKEWEGDTRKNKGKIYMKEMESQNVNDGRKREKSKKLQVSERDEQRKPKEERKKKGKIEKKNMTNKKIIKKRTREVKYE